jgi:Na+-driven multidrug efflux pump
VAAFTGEGAATDALLVGLVSFPLTFVAFLIVIPDHGSTGAAVVSCGSYVVASVLAAYLFLREPRHSLRTSLVPTGEDLRDYVRLARRGLSRIAG